jgi:hypothetical protein
MNFLFQSMPLRFGNTLQLVAGLALFFVIGCGRKEPTVQDINAKVAIQFSPAPPVIGKNDLEIIITDESGKPVQLGMIKVEGNMNHAGMKPIFAELIENEPGKYSGRIDFTMGGDWFLLVSSDESPDGKLNQKIDVPGVKPK